MTNSKSSCLSRTMPITSTRKRGRLAVDTVVRAACVYLFLLVVFRLAGRRSMDQLSSFDLVLLLIISEATQNALLGQDYSFTNAALVITTLVGLTANEYSSRSQSRLMPRTESRANAV